MLPTPSDTSALAGHYQELVRHSSSVISVVDGSGAIEYQSPSGERVLGYPADGLVGETVFDYVHPDDLPDVRTAIAEALESPEGDVLSTECRFRHADGHWIWLSSVAKARGPDGAGGFVVNSRDVTDHREAEAALAAEYQLYESVVEGVNDAIAILRGGVFVFANSQCHELLGFDSGELVGTERDAVIDPEDREMVDRRGSQRLDPEREDPPSRYEVTFRTTDGARIVGEVNVRAIQYDGDPATLVAIRDVTEQRRYEQQLQARNEELEALNRVVRHDIRNDISVILGWAELLEDHVDEEGQEYLENVLWSGQHVVDLTETARDFVGTLTSGGEPDLQRVSLRSVIESEVALAREFYSSATFRVDGALPDVSVRATEMLSSVFTNLLRNAVQHSPSPEPTVTLSLAVEDGAAVARVADDGPGVPDAAKERIFGKGEKGLDSDGTGIGLYLVRSLVEQYGGDVVVEDNEPEGAVFVVRLPLAG